MTDIKRLKLNKKQIAQYKEKSIHSTIQPPYLAIRYHYHISPNDMFSPDISGDNKKLFMSKFGKVDYAFDSWYRSYNWFVEFMGAVFTISSSKRGTTYYLVDAGSNKEVNKLCYDFCIEMRKIL